MKTLIALLIALALMLGTANADIDSIDTFGLTNNKAFMEWFEKAKVGDSYTGRTPAGNGCNTCEFQIRKVSETEVYTFGITSCTLMNCYTGSTFKIK